MSHASSIFFSDGFPLYLSAYQKSKYDSKPYSVSRSIPNEIET
jgi:hypothetical protein